MFLYNKGQIYLPNYEKAFGSEFLKLKLPDCRMRKKSSHYRYYQDYLLKRMHLKALDKEQQRCDQDDDAGNTTKCITEYLEREVGCSMDLQGSTLLVPRLYRFTIT